MRDRSEGAPRHVFELSGGNLALDFTNTVSRRPTGDAVERLLDYERLVSWGEQAGVLSLAEGNRLRAESSKHPRVAASVLRHAIELREAIFALFSARAARQVVPAAALETVNRALPDALGRLRLESGTSGIEWGWSSTVDDLGAMLPPVVRACADLLTSPQIERVRECRSETCAWLFLDHSKNGTRCWCDMSVCGNRAKARRHYARSKSASGSPHPPR